MNRDRLKILADWLRDGAPHELITFDMRTGFEIRSEFQADPGLVPQCQTACCIAGCALQFFGDPGTVVHEQYLDGDISADDPELSWDVVCREAARLLDLDFETAERLFIPSDHFFHPSLSDDRVGYMRSSLVHFNDPQWAARTIDHMLETGVIDWSITYLPPPAPQESQHESQ